MLIFLRTGDSSATGTCLTNTRLLLVDSKLTYFGAQFETECGTFRPTSTVLDHSLVVACDLTQILLQVLITHWWLPVT